MKCFAIILCFVFCSGVQALGQNSNSDWATQGQSVALEVYWGYLQYHHQEMAYLKQTPAQAVKLSYILNSSGSKLWHSIYRYPKVGISYMLMDLGHHNILGYSHTISPFIKIPVFSLGEKCSSDFFVGSGLSYLPKIYHPVSNSLNTAISTHINVNIDLGFSVSYCVNNNLKLSSGAHIAHFSNGSIKKPNYGLNYTLLSLGVQYGNFNLKPEETVQNIVKDEKHRILLVTSGSVKEATGFNGPKFGVASGSIEYSRQVWLPLFRVGTSLDFMYDDSHSLILQNNNILYNSNWELTKLGIAINAELILDRLSLILHFGGYYHNLSGAINNQWVYQRVGLRYKFTNGLWAHVALKTHLNYADYIEFGLAFKLF
ncbi:MAG: acyloxyacyl hydrolase [Tenuifilaceae bacterium]|nr:acyloxyacyl hydrolase [Tenuifilaceae bacterium]